MCAISLDNSYVLLMFNIVKASIMKNGQLMKKDSLDLVLLNHYAISNMNFLSKIFDIVSISQFVYSNTANQTNFFQIFMKRIDQDTAVILHQ